MNRICIIGVGLIGGSLGLALRRHRADLQIVGVDEVDVLQTALSRGAITESADTLEEGIRNADLVLLCTPVDASIALLADIGPLLGPNTLVSDVCSVKLPLMEEAVRSLENPERFIGGHPMTGSERQGIKASDEFLFENATYVLCPPSRTDPALFRERHAAFVDLIELTGARLLIMDANRHDRIAARISHLPQLLAIALVNSIGNRLAVDPDLLVLSAGGFRDMTRIASSSYSVWKDILSSNSSQIKEALDGFVEELIRLRRSIESDDSDTVASMFASAESTRTAIPRRSKGFLQPIADVFVFVSDQPGAIFHMTGCLAEADINIKDIELLKIREGTGGTFRIGFESETRAEQAATTLTEAGFKVHRL